MSLTLNMVGGGGGKLKDTDAILLVTVPTGSSVTATKGAITLTPTIWTTSGDNTLDRALFTIPASTFDSNAWTVTATLNGDTASGTIVINAAKEYAMGLSYNLYLYHNGIIVTPLDAVRCYTSDNSTASITNANSLLDIYLKYNSGGTGATYQYGTSNAVDVTDYSSLVVVVDSESGWCNGYIGVYSSKSGTGNQALAYTTYTNAQTGTYTVDISSVTGNAYPAFRLWCGTNNQKHIYISDWYLER